MKTKSLFLLVLGAICTLNSVSQTTDELLLEKYWQYRERTRRHFVKVGKENGESIPIIRIEPNYEMLIIPADKVNLAVPENQKWELIDYHLN